MIKGAESFEDAAPLNVIATLLMLPLHRLTAWLIATRGAQDSRRYNPLSFQ